MSGQIDKLIRALQQLEDAGGPVHYKDAAGPQAVDALAVGLNLTIPDSFRIFYSTFEYIEFGPVELLSVSEIADQYRMLQEVYRSAASNLLPFIADDAGGYYCVVCHKTDQDKTSEFGCVIYVVGCQPFQVEYRASSLLSFLISRVEEDCEDIKMENK